MNVIPINAERKHFKVSLHPLKSSMFFQHLPYNSVNTRYLTVMYLYAVPGAVHSFNEQGV